MYQKTWKQINDKKVFKTNQEIADAIIMTFVVFLMWTVIAFVLTFESLPTINYSTRGLQSVEVLKEAKKIQATITAYSEIDSCHYDNCVMASGKRAYIGAIACPRNIPLGKKVEIENLGIFTCEDRTAKRYDGRYDIFMGFGNSAYNEAIKFGKQKLTINKIKL